MKIDKMVWTNEDWNACLVIFEDGSERGIGFPGADDTEKQLIEQFGGQYAIEKCTVDYTRELLAMEARWEKFQKQEDLRQQALSITTFIEEELKPEDAMIMKMSMFNHDFVKNCRDKELLAGLRKADNAIDIMMYFGMIRKQHDTA